MREFVELCVRSLVEHPDDVDVTIVPEDADTVVEVRVAEDDLGRVIGRGGRIANAIRTLARSAASPDEGRVLVEIIE